MGAWGPGPFDNDDANDFADLVGSRDDLAAVEGALDKVLAVAGEYLEAPEAWNAAAAAEILTLLAERPSDETEYPDQIEEWAAESAHVPSGSLLAKAARALDRILAAPSELLELWSESEDLPLWKASIEDTKRRLTLPQVD